MKPTSRLNSILSGRPHFAILPILLVLLMAMPNAGRCEKEELGRLFNRLFDRNAATPTPAPPRQPLYPVVLLSGSIDEKPSPYDFVVPESYTVRDVLDLIETAKNDPYVEGMVLYIDSPDLGWARTEQLRRALLDFQSGGRAVYAYLFDEETQGYLLATACKTITMPESMLLDLTGVRADLYFVRDLLDKIGAKADVVAVGRYKDAMDSFTEREMTGPSREMMTSLVDDLTSQAVAMIAESRRLPPEKAREAFEGGPYTAEQARQLGLIDDVAYYDQKMSGLETQIGHPIDLDYEYGAAEEETQPLDLFSLLKDLMKSEQPSAAPEKPYVALIYAVGEIVSGRAEDYPFAEDLIAQDDFIDMLDDIESDDSARAVVLRIDSPGGSAEAADILWNRLKLMNETLPIVVTMGDLAASGGYYIATPGDRIFAERGTLTGSIGVIGAKLVLADLYKKIGINTQSVGGGRYSGLFAEDRAWNEDERDKMRTLMIDTYTRFVGKVADDRGMSVDAVDKVAQGRVWTGRQAREIGLVDDIGGIDDALSAAKQMAGFKPGEEIDVVVYPRPKGLVEYVAQMLGLGMVRAGGHSFARSDAGVAPGSGRFHRHAATRRPATRGDRLPAGLPGLERGFAHNETALLAGAAGMLPVSLRHSLMFALMIRSSRFLARAPYEIHIH